MIDIKVITSRSNTTPVVSIDASGGSISGNRKDIIRHQKIKNIIHRSTKLKVRAAELREKRESGEVVE